ncbi:MAG TPA: cytochrome d ubiquinol oxidase subunit II [Vicinamibacterales bacterium]|nr:cytochrome d ubiquinol oxidase subunit II [Vicinamibacterales bacterium]
MIELWFGLATFTLTMFAVLDGWNIGAGIVHFLVGRTTGERREVVAAIGPSWSWHEVWLIAFGGTLLLAFPRVLAVAFSGFYLALWFLLWSFVLRGMSIELGGHIADRMWQRFWDFVFTASSLLLALLLGAALGNVLRGVPIDASGEFSMPLFTDFDVRGEVGLLDWYTIAVALYSALIVAAHGATYLRLRTGGMVHRRSARLARRLWLAAFVLFPFFTWMTWIVRPGLYEAMRQRPTAWLAILILVSGGLAIGSGLLQRRLFRAFAGSCAVIAGLLAGSAAGVFPTMLHSTIAPSFSITAHAGATAGPGLGLALLWWPVALALALTYGALLARSYRGKVREAD